MILFIAGRGTAGIAARVLRSMPSGTAGTGVLTPEGLSVPGWAHDPEHPAGDRAVIDGQVRQSCQLTGVVTALDAVLPADLPHVTAGDRDFVAAEMTAFLRDWLATLACPVIDRPTTLALSGRAADPATWSAAAATLGVTERLGTAVPVTRITTVTVAADRVISPAPASRPARAPCRPPASRLFPAEPMTAAERAVKVALDLARTAGVTAARLMFSAEAGEPALVGAAPWWHVPSPLVLRAILASIGERTGLPGGDRRAIR
jgi:hypothetical protein